MIDFVTLAGDGLNAQADPAPVAEWETPGELAALITPDVVQTPALDLVDQAVMWAHTTPGARLIISMPPQEGKALALDTPIATPDGWAVLGDLRIGDRVFGDDGRPCTVTALSPIWTGRPCYEVTTGDGGRIVADGAHEWRARLDRRSGWRIHETTALARPRAKSAQLPMQAPLALPEADLPVHPWVLGMWLGDGTSKSGIITAGSADMTWTRAEVERCGHATTDQATAGTFGIPGLRPALRPFGVIGNKHIPTAYLRASREQRLALLQGLVDSDGYVSPKGQVEFCSVNEVLAAGAHELALSLGVKATVRKGRAMLNGVDCGPKYRVRFYMADAARMPRKRVRCRDAGASASVRYVTARPTATVPVRCISVDSPSRLFLAGREMVVTHNSERVTKTGSLWALARNPETRIAIVSYAQPLAEGFGRDVRNWISSNDGTEGTFNIGLKIAADNGSARRWQLAGHRGGIVCVGLTGGLTGRPADALVIDDPFSDREQAASARYRERVWSWWQSVGSTRLARTAPVILINTRWHEDDLAGRFLAAEDGHRWRVLNIPALADHDPAKGEADPLGRMPGEWLTSARGRTATEWEAIRIQAGTRTFNALYQGRPSPDAGNVWQRPWWRRYGTPLWSQHPTTPGAYRVEECDELIMSWDMAFKDTKSSDYVVGQVWARRGANVYLLDQVHKRLTFTETVIAFKAMTARWPQATAKYVEDKANGTAIIDTLKSKIPGIVAITPTESKYARANAVAPMVQAGNVFLPEAGIALFDPEELIDEAAGFPNAAHDDQVDATSQALAQMLLDGTGAQAWIEYARRKAEAITQGAAQAAPEPAVDRSEAGSSQPDDPVAARKRARDAAFRQRQGR